MLESKPDYGKVVFLMFLIKSDADLLRECGFLKSDTTPLDNECKSILMEQNEEYLEYIKNEEESIIERTLNE